MVIVRKSFRRCWAENSDSSSEVFSAGSLKDDLKESGSRDQPQPLPIGRKS
jgi:hypothetical protein